MGVFVIFLILYGGLFFRVLCSFKLSMGRKNLGTKQMKKLFSPIIVLDIVITFLTAFQNYLCLEAEKEKQIEHMLINIDIF